MNRLIPLTIAGFIIAILRELISKQFCKDNKCIILTFQTAIIFYIVAYVYYGCGYIKNANVNLNNNDMYKL